MAKSKAPQFEKEKIMDRRIGIRLNSIFWPIDQHAVSEILFKLKYSDISYDPSTASHSARKHGTEFYTNYARSIFGFHNVNINSLIEAQKEFFSVANREYKADISEHVRFYEVECISNIITENDTAEIFAKISEGFPMKNDVEAVLDRPLRLNKLELSSPKPHETDQWDQIEVSPRLESNGKMYFCRLLSRGQHTEELYKMLRHSSDFFEQIIKKLES